MEREDVKNKMTSEKEIIQEIHKAKKGKVGVR